MLVSDQEQFNSCEKLFQGDFIHLLSTDEPDDVKLLCDAVFTLLLQDCASFISYEEITSLHLNCAVLLDMRNNRISLSQVD